MRLDKYLKVSRLIKRRTVANEACDAGRVLLNDRPARASASVKAGDIIEIQFGMAQQKEIAFDGLLSVLFLLLLPGIAKTLHVDGGLLIHGKGKFDTGQFCL